MIPVGQTETLKENSKCFQGSVYIHTVLCDTSNELWNKNPSCIAEQVVCISLATEGLARGHKWLPVAAATEQEVLNPSNSLWVWCTATT